jgi:hypothetical protein
MAPIQSLIARRRGSRRSLCAMRDALADSRAVWLTAHALARDVVTAEAVEALRGAGVRSVVLKGPSIARWLYADGTPRPYGDSDLLVGPADLEQASRALESIGYSLLFDDRVSPTTDAHHLVWQRQETGPKIELHWRLSGVRAPAEMAWRRLSAGTEATVLAGAEVEFLGLAARTLHLALHARQDQVERAKPLEDLRRGVRLVDESCWRAAADLAAAVDATDAFAAGVRAVPEGVALAADLGLPPTSLSMLVEMRSAGVSFRAIAVRRLWYERGPLGTARELVRVAVPPVAYMRYHFAEAGASRVDLAAAYARRWSRLVRMTVPVVWTLIRAKRRTGA